MYRISISIYNLSYHYVILLLLICITLHSLAKYSSAQFPRISIACQYSFYVRPTSVIRSSNMTVNPISTTIFKIVICFMLPASYDNLLNEAFLCQPFDNISFRILNHIAQYGKSVSHYIRIRLHFFDCVNRIRKTTCTGCNKRNHCFPRQIILVKKTVHDHWHIIIPVGEPQKDGIILLYILHSPCNFGPEIVCLDRKSVV